MFNLSVPDKAMKNSNYKTITYEEHKQSLAENSDAAVQGQGAGGPPQEQPPLQVKNWREDSKVSPVLLRMVFESKTVQMRTVKCTLTLEDNDKKNVKFPLSTISENIFTNAVINAGLFQKIDPSKEGWGDIKIEVTVKDYKRGTSSSSSPSGDVQSAGASYYCVPGYGADSGGTTAGWADVTAVGPSLPPNFEGSYAQPQGAQGGGDKVPCFWCKAPADVGQEWCMSCG